MPIKYYPNRIFKKLTSPVDRMMINNKIHVANGQHDLVSDGFSDRISSDYDFQINSIKMNFSNDTERTYFVKIASGRRIVTNYNDYLWFSANGSMPRKITLNPGFYNGDEMADLLQLKLNTTDGFPNDFEITYTESTGIFLIKANTGKIKYLDINEMETLRNMDSIAGHLFGFNENTELLEEIVNDTPIFGLNNETTFINNTNDVLDHYFDDTKTLSMDQALVIEAESADVVMNYEVTYKEIV